MEKLEIVKKSYFWDNKLSFYDNISSRVVYLLIFLLLLFLVNLGKRDLWAPDEPRYAEVSREMQITGDYILPHLNFEKYPDKPPVLFWLINLFSIPFGKITALSARLHSALSGIGCAILLYFFAKRILARSSIKNPHRISFLAALILSTSMEYTVASRRVSFDVLLTFLVTLSLFCFYTGYIRKKGNTRFFFASYIVMSISIITKGPVGLLLPMLTIIVFLCVEKFRNPNYMFRIRDMHICLGVFVVFSIPLLWITALYFQGGGEHLKEVVFTQNAGRTINSWSHNRQFYYFLLHFPSRFLPWSFFIPGVVIYYIKRLKKEKNNSSNLISADNLSNTLQEGVTAEPDIRTALRFPFIWFVVIFTFFSVMSCKRTTYLLPLYPAAAIFMGWFFNELISNTSYDKTLKWFGRFPMFLIFSLLIILGIGAPVWAYYHYITYFYYSIPVSIVFVCGQIVSFVFLLRSDHFKSLITSFIVFLLTAILITHFLIPVLNEEKSAKTFSIEAHKIVGNSDNLRFYKYTGEAYLFYSGRGHVDYLEDLDDINDHLRSDEQVFFAIKEIIFGWIKGGITVDTYVLVRHRVGHRIMILVSNKPFADDHDWGKPDHNF